MGAQQNRSVQIPKGRLKPLKPKPKPSASPAAAGNGSASKIKGDEAIRLVEELRKKLHKELLDILEAEQKKEGEREEALKKAPNDEEHKKLEKAFGIERAKASERIIKMSE